MCQCLYYILYQRMYDQNILVQYMYRHSLLYVLRVIKQRNQIHVIKLWFQHIKSNMTLSIWILSILFMCVTIYAKNCFLWEKRKKKNCFMQRVFFNEKHILFVRGQVPQLQVIYIECTIYSVLSMQRAIHHKNLLFSLNKRAVCDLRIVRYEIKYFTVTIIEDFQLHLNFL